MRHSEGTDDRGPHQYSGGRVPRPPVTALIDTGAPVAAEADVRVSSRVLAPTKSRTSSPDGRSRVMCCWNRALE
jgi:hypothetical protein